MKQADMALISFVLEIGLWSPTGDHHPTGPQRRPPAHILYSKSMFVRRLSIQRIDPSGAPHPCPIAWIDNFAMRNFTNNAVFDDTLPVADGLLEAGSRVPLDRLQPAMEDWFRRKGYLKPEDRLAVSEIGPAAPQSGT
jgi:hypothetical protein